jgi:hypothetical protein
MEDRAPIANRFYPFTYATLAVAKSIDHLLLFIVQRIFLQIKVLLATTQNA